METDRQKYKGFFGRPKGARKKFSCPKGTKIKKTQRNLCYFQPGFREVCTNDASETLAAGQVVEQREFGGPARDVLGQCEMHCPSMGTAGTVHLHSSMWQTCRQRLVVGIAEMPRKLKKTMKIHFKIHYFPQVFWD